ncbi:dipeptidase [Kocuria palustris]|uniref:dipeptidase n=1 Tax=Kocuria palustris TaxID=71999 RepID=UPI0011A88CEC|nr:dipeptidase [Kocuria palustris]
MTDPADQQTPPHSAAVPAHAAGLDIEAFRAAVDREFDRVVDQLGELVAIPGIAWDSFDPAQLRRSAEAVAGLLQAEGFETVEIRPADGEEAHPAVIARTPAAHGRPTVLLYAHHDVQPPGDPEAWTSPPFEARRRDGRLWGRGAADDKAGVMAHVAAVRVLRDVLGADHGLGITVFVEGEEEAGSPHFSDFLARHREELAADAIVIADSANWQVGVPTLTTSLRGVVGAVVEVRGVDHTLHSGGYGGPVLDGPTLLARLIATLHDDDGAVAVEGLRSRVGEDGDGALRYDERQFREDAGVLPGVELAGRGSLTSRLWTQPALSVTGFDATGVDVASNTIAPSARARLSLRIAPGQDPVEAARLLREHLESHAPFGAQVEVRIEETGPAFATDTSAEAARDMLWALSEAWRRPSVEMGMGGSIPFTADLQAAYPQAAILVTGIEDPDTRAHGIDESLQLEDYRRAIVAEALWLAARAGSAHG